MVGQVNLWHIKLTIVKWPLSLPRGPCVPCSQRKNMIYHQVLPKNYKDWIFIQERATRVWLIIMTLIFYVRKLKNGTRTKIIMFAILPTYVKISAVCLCLSTLKTMGSIKILDCLLFFLLLNCRIFCVLKFKDWTVETAFCLFPVLISKFRCATLMRRIAAAISNFEHIRRQKTLAEINLFMRNKGGCWLHAPVPRPPPEKRKKAGKKGGEGFPHPPAARSASAFFF